MSSMSLVYKIVFLNGFTSVGNVVSFNVDNSDKVLAYNGGVNWFAIEVSNREDHKNQKSYLVHHMKVH
jgi:hypothetical protein